MPSLNVIFWRLLEGPPIDKLLYQALAARERGGKFLMLARYYQLRIRKRYACYISYKAAVGRGIKMPHPVAIVIGDGVRIGNSVTVYQNVTIGAARVGDGGKGLYPSIGDNVTLFAGAKLIGPIRVGDNAVVAANAVVLCDVPANCVAVGVPAKIKPRVNPTLPGASSSP